jgi:hypothetical protein
MPDPVMFQRFLAAADYWFGYSDTSSAGSYNSTRECFMVGIGDVSTGRMRRGLAMEKTPGLGDKLRLRPGTYKIQYEDGRVVTNAWNIKHLRPFYP